jgi:hypothetical protein
MAAIYSNGGVTAGICLASILLKEMRYLVYIRYLWSNTIHAYIPTCSSSGLRSMSAKVTYWSTIRRDAHWRTLSVYFRISILSVIHPRYYGYYNFPTKGPSLETSKFSLYFGVSVAPLSDQVPFTSAEIVGSIHATNSCETIRVSQRSAESRGFSPGAPVSSHRESWQDGWG